MNLFRVTVCGLAVAAIGWGCGDGDSNPSGPSTATGPTISIVGQNGTQAFTPNPASFGGQTVVFKNNDSVVHRVVLNDNSIDTGDIAPGATSRAVLIPTSGTNYHCFNHPGMIGSVSGSAGGAPPTCEGIYCNPY
jgi:plastocyanin